MLQTRKLAYWVTFFALTMLATGVASDRLLAQSAEALAKKAETDERVRELAKSLGVSGSSAETERTLKDAKRVLDSATKAAEESKRVAEEAGKSAAEARKATVIVPAGVPASYDQQEDGLERLRRNQRVLTEQRIGDSVLILRGNQ